MTQTFNDYGIEFQEKFVQALLTDERWAESMLDVFKSEYVEVKHLQFLADRYFEYAKKYRVFPTLRLLISIIKSELKTNVDAVLRDRIVEYIKKIKDNPDASDLPWVKDKSLDFCRKQALKDALVQSVDMIENENYESIVEVVKNAVMVGTAPSIGHDIIEDIDSRFERVLRDCIPTGIPQLDRKGILNGGSGKGALHVVISGTGGGKSHWLVNIGKGAFKNGYNVAHYTMELNEADIGIRYDSNLCEIDADDIYENKNEVQEFYTKNASSLGRLKIKEFPTNYATIFTIKSHLERLSLKGFKPDLIIVDYADVMRSSRKFDSLRHELRQVYEDLRQLAGELRVPVWTACFHGDTVIQSPFGDFKIKDMVGKKNLPVYAYNHEIDRIEIKTVNDIYLSNESAEVYEVELDNGEKVIATPTHKFMLRNGEYAELQSLEVGQSLMPLRRYTLDDFWEVIEQNDGTIERVADMLDVWRDERTKKIDDKELKKSAKNRKTARSREQVTKFGSSRKERIKMHEDVAKMCASREQYNNFTSDIPLRAILKNQIWDKIKNVSNNHKVVSIKKMGRTAVYNMEVDCHHNYALGAGIIVKNSQSNKEGALSDIIDITNMSEAFGKAMTADFIISISRKAHEKALGTGRAFIAKNRAGRDGIIYPITINTARSQFTLGSDPIDQEDARQSDETEQKKRMKATWRKLQQEKSMSLVEAHTVKDIKEEKDDEDHSR